MKTITVKLACLISVEVPNDATVEQAVAALERNLEKVKKTGNLFLTVDDCNEMPELVDEVI